MKIINNKKGLSDVVTTVLIILFAIVAVAVVGGIVLNQINKAGTSINKASICTDNIIEPVSCVMSTNTIVGYKRSSGELNVKSGSLVFTGTKTNGQVSSMVLAVAPPTVLQPTKGQAGSVTLSGAGFSNVKVSAIYYVAGNTGDEQSCISRTIDCIQQ